MAVWFRHRKCPECFLRWVAGCLGVKINKIQVTYSLAVLLHDPMISSTQWLFSLLQTSGKDHFLQRKQQDTEGEVELISKLISKKHYSSLVTCPQWSMSVFHARHLRTENKQRNIINHYLFYTFNIYSMSLFLRRGRYWIHTVHIGARGEGDSSGVRALDS